MREYTHRMQILSKVWHDLDLKCRFKHEVEVRTDLLAPYQTVLCYDLRNLSSRTEVQLYYRTKIATIGWIQEVQSV